MTERTAGPRQWWGLAVLVLPTILISLDMSVLHLAVPHLSADLRPSSTQLLWIVDIYGFLIAGLLIPMGTLGDRIGRRRLLLVGAAGFAVASVVAAFSTSAPMLIAARALLGVAGATLMPSTMSLLRTMFTDDRQRAFAISVWMAGFVLGGALGPAVGGVMLEQFWWGSVFLLGVPVMIVLVVTGPVLLPEFRSAQPRRFDGLSTFLLLGAVLSLVYAVKEYAAHGVAAGSTLILVAALALGAVFVRRQRTLADPMLDLGLFRRPAFGVALAAMFVAMFVMAGSQFFLAQFVQMVGGRAPLEAGLLMLPISIAMVLGTLLAPWFAARVRPAYVMAAGLAVAATGLGALSQVSTDSGMVLLVAGGAIMSLGLGPTPALGTAMVLGAAPAEKAGEASAVQETGAELGTAFGLAVLGAAGTAVYRAEVSRALPDSVPAGDADAIQDSIGSAMATLANLPETVQAAALPVIRTAFTDGFRLSAAVSAAVTVGIMVLVVATLRRVAPGFETPPDEAAGRDQYQPVD